MEATATATMGGANFFDEEWDYSSFGKIFFTEEDASSSSAAAATDLMLQFFHGDDDDATAAAEALFTNGCRDDTIFWPVINNQNVAVAGAGADGTTNLMCSDTFLDYKNFDNIVVTQESSSRSEGCFFPNQLLDFDVNHLITDGSMDLSCPLMIGIQENNYLGNSETDSHLQNAINAVVADVESELQPLKRKFESTSSDDGGSTNNIGTECSEIPNNKKNKKTRVGRNAQKNKNNVEPIKSRKNRNNKKEKQIIVNSKKEEEEEEEEEENTVGGQNIIGQSSSSCYSSEDDSNADDKTSGPALNLNGKTRATRGAATDPQSLYARRRRERINERLRILQILIPNGTKVDISTMLEEAVHYVKFLQLQIKLLSSDDMWMYAPIVYNGLDIGQFGKIFPTL